MHRFNPVSYGSGADQFTLAGANGVAAGSSLGPHGLNLPIPLKIATLALGQSYICSCTSERVLEDMGQTISWIRYPGNTQRNNNVIITSKRRSDVVLT